MTIDADLYAHGSDQLRKERRENGWCEHDQPPQHCRRCAYRNYRIPAPESAAEAENRTDRRNGISTMVMPNDSSVALPHDAPLELAARMTLLVLEAQEKAL